MGEVIVNDEFIEKHVLPFVEKGEDLIVVLLKKKGYSNARKMVRDWEEVHKAFSDRYESEGNKILDRLKYNITKINKELEENAYSLFDFQLLSWRPWLCVLSPDCFYFV